MTPTRQKVEASVAGRDWHAMEVADVVSFQQTDLATGLSPEEAERRMSRFGPNHLPQSKSRPAWLRFIGQFHNILIYVLLAAAAGALFLGDGIDAWVILGVVVINAIIGFIQEGKAESALNAIRNMLSLSATVLRAGSRTVMPADGLVPGDVVFLQAGDKAPADLRLTETRNLGVDESALTGESGTVFKAAASLAADTVLAERCCMAYSGTLIVNGQGWGVVVATGAQTELGRISALLSQVSSLETPLQRQLTRFGHWLTVAILAMSGAVFGFGMLVRGHALQDMFMAMVAIAVAAIPEGLPAVVTITLAVGVQRMARRAAIVRRLPAVETLGEVTVICSDKTGTLTANAMTVRNIVLAGARCGFDGDRLQAGDEVVHHCRPDSEAFQPDVVELMRAAVLCNDARLHDQDGAIKMDGDPTEGALLMLARSAGVHQQDEMQRLPRHDCIPFASEHRFMATLHRADDGSAVIYLKGAPEAVIPRCALQWRDGESQVLDTIYWDREAEALARNGERLLSIAYKRLAVAPDRLDDDEVRQGFILLGLCGLQDPPRDEAISAVASCQNAGIRVKMITGDHGLTAQAIGRQLGIVGDQAALLGGEIDAMDDTRLIEEVNEHDVFARTSPEHKLRLVRALQANGEVVAMTGDGVNDAPALKAADVGVAMGLRGSEVAKDAAVMVLADDNFASIAHAVEEGRTIHDNLLKAIVFILPTSFAQAGAVIVGLLLGITLPVTPLQILWVNLVTAVTLSISLAFEPSEDQVMHRPPRQPGMPLLNWFSLWRIVFVTVLLVAGLMGLYLYEAGQGANVEASRTAAVNALIVGEIFYLFNSRYIEASTLNAAGLFGNRYVLLTAGLLLALQGLLTYVPFLQDWFGTASIDLASWGRIAAFGLAVYVVVELEKWVMRTFRRTQDRKADAEKSPREAVSAGSNCNHLARYAVLSIVAAIVTIVLKTIAYQVTGSVGLLSDALESLVNLMGAMMALAMLVLASKPPDEEHHYGHGKAEYFSSGFEGSLIILAALGIAYAAFDRILHPQAVGSLDLGVAVSSLAALINFLVAMVLLRVGRRFGSITLEADAHHLMTDVWTSVGVLVGLGAVYLTGWQILDPLIAIAVAINIVWSGCSLLKRSIAGLLDATLPAEENAKIAQVLDSYQHQGIEFHDLRTRQSGLHRFMTVHILVPGSMTVQSGHDLAERIERDVIASVGEITVVTHLEPLEDPASFNHGSRGE
jgi:cation diffusion facilitator family transporter